MHFQKFYGAQPNDAYTISLTAAAVELGNFPRPHIRMRLNENSISIDLTPTKTKKKLGEMRSIRSVNHSSQAACARAHACRRGTAAGSKMRTRCMDHHLSPRGRERERAAPTERASEPVPQRVPSSIALRHWTSPALRLIKEYSQTS